MSATALASRGVLWVLDTLNNVYTFDPAASTGQQWTVIPSGGFTITAVSGVGEAGGAIDAYAMAGTQPLQHTSAGWAPVRAFVASGAIVQWIQGSPDGSGWALATTLGQAGLWQILPGGQWTLAAPQATAPSTKSAAWVYQAAVSRNRLYPSSPRPTRPTLDYSAPSIGLVEQPATPFPPMTPGQQAAYNAISLGLGITIPGGARAQYVNAAAPFAIWEGQLASLAMPPGVSPADWNTMIEQIRTELTYVTIAYDLFVNGISPLNQAIQTAVLPLLGPAAQVVGLTTPDEQQASVGLFFLQMFASVFSGVVGSFGVSGAMAGGVVGSLFTAAVNSLYPGVSQQNPLVQAYAQLGANLSATFLEADAFAQATVNAFTVSFYQALVPAKWQIVNTLWGNYVQNPWNYTPGYDTYQVPCPSCTQYGMPTEYVWFANLLGGPTDLNGPLSPFPAQLLFETRTGLNVDFDAFWRSQGGWTTKRVPDTE